MWTLADAPINEDLGVRVSIPGLHAFISGTCVVRDVDDDEMGNNVWVLSLILKLLRCSVKVFLTFFLACSLDELVIDSVHLVELGGSGHRAAGWRTILGGALGIRSGVDVEVGEQRINFRDDHEELPLVVEGDLD